MDVSGGYGAHVSKSYYEMNAAERLAYRIAKNRAIDEKLAAGRHGLSLDGIVDQLNARRQRASYGAVAALVGTVPRALMNRKDKCGRYSWIVAATNSPDSRRGWPTGYTKNQIHPDCFSQICQGDDTVIDSAEELRCWLDAGRTTS
jgi:hypothetical protein